ncbi:MAG: neutral/alkaline non-lysosomal ceramidase N-terminal domain-containing protein, partial [Candidatus Aminicenantes bacterium]|nr:neutral/alkaline non-lysosomal ceramidase N-terminal domain-containing protein [Candidatus Aminicenantes bacterium]
MSIYKIGIGIHDITGPCSGVAMAGYAMPDQKANGIHMRLRSRAFIIKKDNKSIVYVCADLGMIFQSVSLAVLKKLKDEFGDLYNKDNVILTATHTHSGPGGYSHYFLYNLSITASDEQNFKAITDGIFQSIRKAHEH